MTKKETSEAMSLREASELIAPDYTYPKPTAIKNKGEIPMGTMGGRRSSKLIRPDSLQRKDAEILRLKTKFNALYEFVLELEGLPDHIVDMLRMSGMTKEEKEE